MLVHPFPANMKVGGVRKKEVAIATEFLVIKYILLCADNFDVMLSDWLRIA